MYGLIFGVVKLNVNENFYGLSDMVLKVIVEVSSIGGVYYVYCVGMYLCDMLVELNGLKLENVLIIVGLSLILVFVVFVVISKGKILGLDLFWDIMLMVFVCQGGLEIVWVLNKVDLSIDLDVIYNVIDDDIVMVYICNLNNFIGKLFDFKVFCEFCIKVLKKMLVLVDEVYNELIDDGLKYLMIFLINEGYNIIVVCIFLKIYGLVGMWVGYMFGSEENMEFINKYGLGGYLINQVGLVVVIVSYNDEVFKDFLCQKVKEGCDIIMDVVKVNGLSVLLLIINFVFVNFGDDGDVNVFCKVMEEQDVFICGQYCIYQ